MIDLCKVTAINDQLNDRYVTENTYENVVTYPKLITLTTTLRCNYRCWMCYQQHFKGDLDWRIVERLEPVFPYIKTLQLFGGEPLLYDRMEDLCRMTDQYCCELDIITNGSLLDEKRRALLVNYNASLIKVSLEAATQKTYESIRGGNLNEVMGNLRALAEERSRKNSSKPMLQINFVAMERNIRELPDLVRMAADAGVNKVLVLFMNAQNREDLARESLFLHQKLSDKYMAAAITAGREAGIEVTVPGFFKKSPEGYAEAVIDTTCHSPWKNCIVNMDGSVVFCCGNTGRNLGNILEQNFDELWYNEHITAFRKVVNTQKQPSCCRTCRVKGRSINDPNFHIRDAELVEKLLTGRS